MVTVQFNLNVTKGIVFNIWLQVFCCQEVVEVYCLQTLAASW